LPYESDMVEAVPTFEIDFLPASFREQKSKRQTRAWRAIIVSLVAGSLVLAGLAQFWLSYQARAEINDLAARYDAAEKQNKKLADLQTKLKTLTVQADLYAYLRHPWPRTTILAETLRFVPRQVTIDELRIAQEHGDKPDPTKAKSEKTGPVGDKSAAARDLAKLREERDKQLTVVSLGGTTNDQAALAEYLQQLRSCDLFAKVELGPTESSDDKEAATKFSVRLLVRPAYGQPGGPTGPKQIAQQPAETKAREGAE